MVDHTEHDAVTGRETTGHEWDGIKELNTPLPRWWVYVFYATIVWSIGYWVVYPAWPGISGYTRGLFGYSSREQYAEQVASTDETRRVWTDQFKGQPIEQIVTNTDLLNYGIAGGRGVFAANCTACHGAGGQGAKGYPTLADDDWLWGGDLASIQQTTTHGVRSSADPDTRQSEMPRFGVDGLLTPEQINDAAEFVLSLSNGADDAAAAERGKTIFANQCAACHGEGGKGNTELGAPNLTDEIWLYGGERLDIIAQITNPHMGVMPNWGQRFDETTIKMLTIYVHSLGAEQ